MSDQFDEPIHDPFDGKHDDWLDDPTGAAADRPVDAWDGDAWNTRSAPELPLSGPGDDDDIEHQHDDVDDADVDPEGTAPQTAGEPHSMPDRDDLPSPPGHPDEDPPWYGAEVERALDLAISDDGDELDHWLRSEPQPVEAEVGDAQFDELLSTEPDDGPADVAAVIRQVTERIAHRGD